MAHRLTPFAAHVREGLHPAQGPDAGPSMARGCFVTIGSSVRLAGWAVFVTALHPAQVPDAGPSLACAGFTTHGRAVDSAERAVLV